MTLSVLNFEVYLLLLIVVCIYISISDFFYRRIQNHALLILLILQCFLSPLDIQITSFLLVLGGGLIVYSLIWIGAGDIKYVAALSLTIPLNDLLWAFVMTAFSGGVLASIYLINKKLARKKPNDQQGIPYGIAISVGFYLVILTQNTPYI
jgi:prepilin peptidase CpaA